MQILYDDIQEGLWFQSLNKSFEDAELLPINSKTPLNPQLQSVLAYDRPDIILVDSGKPILVVERTIEVPSGHNVGQRFARLAAAAQSGVPVVYLGPYAAYKHGGQTQGPRYMNLRLFHALDRMALAENTAIATINWPVDDNYEIVRTPKKDENMVEYVSLFLEYYSKFEFADISPALNGSPFFAKQLKERARFISSQIRNPSQYDAPPDSVAIRPSAFLSKYIRNAETMQFTEAVTYDIGMQYIRSDPYTGMTILYDYLYAGGPRKRMRHLILQMPHISVSAWHKAASRRTRKDIKIFKMSADAIIFKDGALTSNEL